MGKIYSCKHICIYLLELENSFITLRNKETIFFLKKYINKYYETHISLDYSIKNTLIEYDKPYVNYEYLFFFLKYYGYNFNFPNNTLEAVILDWGPIHTNYQTFDLNVKYSNNFYCTVELNNHLNKIQLLTWLCGVSNYFRSDIHFHIYGEIIHCSYFKEKKLLDLFITIPNKISIISENLLDNSIHRMWYLTEEDDLLNTSKLFY